MTQLGSSFAGLQVMHFFLRNLRIPLKGLKPKNVWLTMLERCDAGLSSGNSLKTYKGYPQRR